MNYFYVTQKAFFSFGLQLVQVEIGLEEKKFRVRVQEKFFSGSGYEKTNPNHPWEYWKTCFFQRLNTVRFQEV